VNPAGTSKESLTSNPRVREQPGPTAEVEAHQFVTHCTEGFSHFVTSMTAPVASGWSDGRVGLAPTGKRRLTTAHTRSRQSTDARPSSALCPVRIIKVDRGSCHREIHERLDTCVAKTMHLTVCEACDLT
jgi:hypothetical protein